MKRRMSSESRKRISDRMKKMWKSRKKVANGYRRINELAALKPKDQESEPMTLESSPDIVYLIQDGRKSFGFQINGTHLVPIEIRVIELAKLVLD